MAQAASALDLSTPAFKQGEKIPSKYYLRRGRHESGVEFQRRSREHEAARADAARSGRPEDADAERQLRSLDGVGHRADQQGIAEGAGSSMGMNGAGKAGYIGPCPPDREHRYFFRLYAVDIPLAGKMFNDRAALEEAIKGHVLAQSELMGRYEKIKEVPVPRSNPESQAAE